MINLKDVGEKLQKILNGTDSEVTQENPLQFQFVVETEGFHLDSIADQKTKNNFIPVFISAMGGQYNPVKGLNQKTVSIQVAFYYPVRFKNDFFDALEEFLADVFVGSILTYGETSPRKAISNISPMTYGEIVDEDLKQFRTWVDAKYEVPIEVMEPFMSATLTLFLSTVKDGFVYGNDVSLALSFTIDDVDYSIENVFFDDGSIQCNAQPQSEHIVDDPQSASLPFGSTFGSSIRIYPDLSNTGAKTLVSKFLNKEVLGLQIHASFSFSDPNDDLVYEEDCYIQSVNLPIQKGQIVSLTLTFAKEIEEDE